MNLLENIKDLCFIVRHPRLAIKCDGYRFTEQQATYNPAELRNLSLRQISQRPGFAEWLRS